MGNQSLEIAQALPPGAARCPQEPSTQDIIARDRVAAPAWVRCESYEFLGDEDIPFERYTSPEFFKAEMDQAGADYRFVELPGAKHGFSNPDADAHKGHGLDLGYSEEADEQSWADMQALFKQVF